MSTLRRKLHIANCENTWCDQYVGCRGHDITAEYQTSVDIGTVYVDGHYAISGGDGILEGVVAIIEDLFADEAKYFVTEVEWEQYQAEVRAKTKPSGKLARRKET